MRILDIFPDDQDRTDCDGCDDGDGRVGVSASIEAAGAGQGALAPRPEVGEILERKFRLNQLSVICI